MMEQILHALWSRANNRNLVIVREAVLLEELSVEKDELRIALKRLEIEGVVEILSPHPFLALKLRKWPGSLPESAKTAPSAYSFKSYLSQSKNIKDSYRQRSDPHASRVDEQLLQEVLETLGESDPTTFRRAVVHYSPAVIRTTLDRVRRMKTIHKNRTALFRFLLPKIAKESQPSK
jgi:hypothetical protein